MDNTWENRKSFFGERIKDYFGEMNTDERKFSLIDWRLVHIDRLTEHKAEGWELRGEKLHWFAAVRSLGEYATGMTTALADARIAKAEREIPYEEKISDFIAKYEKDKTYEIDEWLAWVRRFTGACMTGRNDFAEERGIDLKGRCTVKYFLEWLDKYGILADGFREIKPYYEDGEYIYETANSHSAVQ